METKVSMPEFIYQSNEDGEITRISPVIGLQDYFAGQALTGIIAFDCSHEMAVGLRAELAYRIADAMLVERERRAKNGTRN